MRRASRLAVGVALALLPAVAPRADALITLELRVDGALRDDVTVHVGANNIGDEPAEDVVPEVTLGDETKRGAEPKGLPPHGFTAAWDLTFPKPTALGTLPIFVQLHYKDGFGHPMSAPAVHVLRTGGSPAGNVDVTLEATDLATTGSATVRIRNREDRPATGTLRLVTSTEIVASPAERPIEVAPGATLTVPVRLENRGALDGSATGIWAAVTLTRPSWVETLTANAAVSILAAPRDDERRYDTVLTAFVAVALVALLLVGGRRLLGPKASPRTRAARRRSRRHS
jgi:hypothetical protein